MTALLAACLIAMAANVDRPMTNTSSVRTAPVTPTPEGNAISLWIAVPKDGSMTKNPVWVQFRIDGFALGSSSSQFERSSEIAESKLGQTIHVVIDDRPYFPVNQASIDPFNEATYYADMSYKFQMPFRLDEGMHTIRMFPARTYGESLKGDKAFAASTFYIGSQEDRSNVDLSAPYITYNEPSEQMYLTTEQPILLDFYVTNAALSPEGYKVKVMIDGKEHRTITAWQPFYIYGLKKGRHTVRLELLDAQNKLVPGKFNKVEESFTVH